MTATRWFETWPIPDWALRIGIDRRCGRTARERAAVGESQEAAFVAGMTDFPIAIHTEAANDQHYELPPEFFAAALGPRRKYSCCHYPTGRETLAEAEIAALDDTIAHAGLVDGQDILELGCGWGSLTLTMAECFPEARILAVSNSASQRAYIEGQAAACGLANVRIVTADMNDFDPGGRFDRIVSVEMFEHMANWRALLERARGWLKPEGRLFLHVFAHHLASYRYDHTDPDDWIGQHFFTGGIMPGKNLPRAFPDLFAVEEQWWWPGTHYRRTARQWLDTFDANIETNRAILRTTYGDDWKLWERRWRLFYLAVEGMFGHAGGSVWGVGHYRLAPA